MSEGVWLWLPLPGVVVTWFVTGVGQAGRSWSLTFPCLHGEPPRGHGMIESAEQGAILKALRACRRNRTNAAEELGVGRTTLWVPVCVLNARRT